MGRMKEAVSETPTHLLWQLHGSRLFVDKNIKDAYGWLAEKYEEGITYSSLVRRASLHRLRS